MTDRTEHGQTGQPWTTLEIEAVVAAYVEMLQRELRGERYSKAETVRRLQALLPARSRGSIELKLQNISAVLDESGREWIEGYKPMPHYQRELQAVVLERMGADHRIGDRIGEYAATPLVAAQRRRLATDDVRVPPPDAPGARRLRSQVSLTGGPIPALADFHRRELGTAGEEWVLDLEREQLRRAGRPDLADRIRWVAREDGDGAGYDVRSFREDGRERLIEVKTTNLGPRTPFYITRWEVDVSRERAEAYSLYRVHGFSRDPRVYVLDGNVEERARLDPKVFLGIPL